MIHPRNFDQPAFDKPLCTTRTVTAGIALVSRLAVATKRARYASFERSKVRRVLGAMARENPVSLVVEKARRHSEVRQTYPPHSVMYGTV